MDSLRTAVEQTILDLANKKTLIDYVTTSEVMIRLPKQPTHINREIVIQQMKIVAHLHSWTVWAGTSGPMIDVRSITGPLTGSL